MDKECYFHKSVSGEKPERKKLQKKRSKSSQCERLCKIFQKFIIGKLVFSLETTIEIIVCRKREQKRNDFNGDVSTLLNRQKIVGTS